MNTPGQDADPFVKLAGAVIGKNAPRAAQVLARHADLRTRLNEELPGGHFGATALLVAVHDRNREMIDLLLGAGADINQRSHWWAGSFGVLDQDDLELSPFLIERGATVDIHAASRLGRLDRIDELLAADPSLIHARGGDGQSPLHFAPTVKVAEFLLQRGADIDARDIDHESTPAQWMVKDRPEVARYLVMRGCTTDILMAAALGELEVVRRHLDADPESIRMSVIDRYFPKRDPRSGGSIYIYTLGWHMTAPALAREFGHSKVYNFLMERTPAGVRLAIACEVGDEAAIESLRASQPDLAQHLSDDERIRIAAAANQNDTAAVRRMIAAGWPVDVRGEMGATPLHWAAWHGNAEMARELLRHQAPVEAKDTDHEMAPLGWAIHGSVHGWHCKTGDYAGTVEALIGAGAIVPKVTDEVDASEPVVQVLRSHNERR